MKHFAKNVKLNKSMFISSGNITIHKTYIIKVTIIEDNNQVEYLGTKMTMLKFSAKINAVKVMPTKLVK